MGHYCITGRSDVGVKLTVERTLYGAVTLYKKTPEGTSYPTSIAKIVANEAVLNSLPSAHQAMITAVAVAALNGFGGMYLESFVWSMNLDNDYQYSVSASNVDNGVMRKRETVVVYH